MIYLDHNATTPVDERVIEAMLPYLGSYYGNPSSLYRLGRLTRTAIDTAREQVAALVGALSSQVIFTSGGTEANNLALTAISPGFKVAISAIEHPSMSEPANRLKNYGCELSLINVDNNGLITEDALTKLADFKPDFVSIMLANNETGVIQNIAHFTQQLRQENVIVHTDAVQAAGKFSVDFNQLGINMMSLSSHKIYGPKGVGALITEKNINLNPMLLGGDQEQGLRSGTENVAAIIGFGKAAELAKSELTQREEHFRWLKGLLEDRLRTISGLKVFAQDVDRLTNTTQFGIAGYDGEMLLMKLDQKGIAVSSGSACASGGGKPSPVLAAMGVGEEMAKSAIRVSLGKDNTESDIIEFTQQLKLLVTG